MSLENTNPFFGLLLVGGVLLGMILFCILPMVVSARTLNRMDKKEED